MSEDTNRRWSATIVAWPSDGAGATTDRVMPSDSDTEDSQLRKAQEQAQQAGYLDGGYVPVVIHLHETTGNAKTTVRLQYDPSRGWVRQAFV